VIVPPLCVCCLEPELSGRALCERCRRGLKPVADPRCGRCGAPLAADACRECHGRTLSFDRAWAAFTYEDAARSVVHALKVRCATVAAHEMADTIARRAPATLLDGVLVPVPAHGWRRWRDGFNQAHELAGALAKRRDLELRDVLARTRSRRQVGLERNARIANAAGSVVVRDGSRPPPVALLVDDVYTTGATIDACARALRDAGTEHVVALTFARAVRSRHVS
jgi:ComF family protein